MNDQPAPSVPPSPIPPPTAPATESQARTWNMLCHLSALAGLIVPFGGVLGPLIIWLIKKNEIPSVDVHGKAAVNFQLTIFIGAIATAIAAFILSFILIGFLLIPVVFLIALCGLIFAVIAGIKASDGKDYRYPYSLELIK